MKNSISNLLSVGGVLMVLSGNAYADVTDHVEKSFEVNEDSALRLDNVNGSVEIVSWDEAVIKVSATITADDQSDRDNIVIDMQQTDAGVRVETRYKEKSSWKSNNSGQVEYVIMVPSDTELSAIDLVNGSLVIKGVKGDINAELVNGSIKASGLAANSEFSSVNGSVKVSYDSLNESVDKIAIETVNGSIKLSVPKSVNANVNAETMHGSIKTDFGLYADKNFFSGNHLSGDIGSGNIKIMLESVNGSVKLLSN
jgi:DUF4097 and DUF4098 domain-containing protein YvlB